MRGEFSVLPSACPAPSSKLHKNLYQTENWLNHEQKMTIQKDSVVELFFLYFLLVKSDKNRGGSNSGLTG